MSASLLYLSEENVRKIGIPADTMLELVAATLRSKQAGGVEMPAKLGVHPRPRSFLHAMPGYLQDSDTVGLKWIGYYPDNLRHGIATINGLIILNQPDNGLPVALLDGNWITAFRTAAVSAMSCQLLAQNMPTSLGLVGYGVQAESHLQLFNELFPLDRIQVWGPDRERCRQFVDRNRDLYHLPITVAGSAEEAVRGKDLVISVTPIGVTPVEQLQHRWLKPDAVVCPVEFDSAWDRELFQQAGLLVTDDLGQFESYRNKGFFSGVPTPRTELAELLTGKTSRVPERRGVAVAINLGIGLMDIAFAAYLCQQAQARGIGQRLLR